MEKKSTKNIRTAFLLNLVFSVIELVGGLATNSISIIADSLHDFCDSMSIAVSWFLEKKSEKKPNKTYTYGYARFSLLGALISTMFLLVSSVVVIFSAVPRIINPVAIDYDGVLILAVWGLFVNGLAAFKTSKGHSINEKAINLHLLEDVFGWASVLVAGFVMKIFDIPVLDPILSVLIAAFILYRVAKNLKQIFEILLEKAPDDLNIDDLTEHISHHEHIIGVHHVHLWSLDGSNNYITLHVIVDHTIEKDDIADIKRFIREELEEHNICHCTIEIEYESEACHDHECVVEHKQNHGHIGHHHH